MKVEELIIDGFKSYATRTVISGWDSLFNAITGLNGSGKSNILDAICFVLGISTMSTVRAQNLQDLIYKRGQAGVTKASVTIVFDNTETSKSPIGFENCPKISVTRQIILGGTSKYLINGHKAQQQTVLNLFQSVQLNINNPNFLIMQGRITKVLNMKATEILSLIEEAAGTRTFEDRKDKAQRTMAKKESKLVEIRNLLQEEIEPKLEKLRSQKRTFLEYQQTQSDLENLSRVLAAYNYIENSKRFNEHQNLLNEKEAVMGSLSTNIDRIKIEIENLNNDLANVKLQRENEMKKDGKIKELETSENQISEEITRLNTSKDITTENVNEELKKVKKLESQISNLQTLIDNSDDIYKNHESSYNESKQVLVLLKEEFNKKEELLNSLSTGISTKGSGSVGYQAQLKEAKDKFNASNNVVKLSQLKIEHLNKQLKENRSKLEEAKQEYDHLVKNIEVFKKKIESKEQQLVDLGYNPTKVNELRKQEQNLQNQISKNMTQLDYLRREVGNVEFNYTKPYPEFNTSSVKGTAVQLFNLQDGQENKAMALQICAGGRLYNVVVENSDDASSLLEKGQLRKRVTIIPLDKIHPRPIGEQAVKHAKTICPGQVEIAINLIDFDKDLTKAMQYIFGSTFICDSPDVAKTITFDPKIRARSITLEGDIYDPEGNLSGGSRKNTSSLLITMQKYNNVQNEVNDLKYKLNEVQKELNHYEKLSEQTRELQNELNLGKQELLILERKLENNQATIIVKDFEAKEAEISKLQLDITLEQAKSQDYKTDISKIEEDMKEFNSNKGNKLKQLEKEVNELRNQVVEKQEEISDKEDEFQNISVETEQRKTELESIKENIDSSNKLLVENKNKIEQIDTKVLELSEQYEYVKQELEQEKAKILGLNEEMNELMAIIQSKTSELSESELALQKLNHELETSTQITKSLKAKLDNLIQEYDWVVDSNIVNRILEEYPNFDIAKNSEQASVLQEKFQDMKRKVNTNIMSMIDNVEKKETSLKHMIKTIEKDKSKIINTIEKLNGYKRDTLNTTYTKVSYDFGNIFSDLLPGSFAKLVPVNNEDVTKGLEVKVKLGSVWKESLVELSGGQRSLVALSLIMALLQFKPAPMYILDEVDAALDLSHTQNIGHLIKTRFKGSQFIVVSLKEGMFTNANRVFRTRFQDGTSVVSIL